MMRGFPIQPDRKPLDLPHEIQASRGEPRARLPQRCLQSRDSGSAPPSLGVGAGISLPEGDGDFMETSE